jgi:hypothetical protein
MDSGLSMGNPVFRPCAKAERGDAMSFGNHRRSAIGKRVIPKPEGTGLAESLWFCGRLLCPGRSTEAWPLKPIKAGLPP